MKLRSTLLTFFCLLCATLASGQTAVTVNLANHHQTVQGIGVATAFQCATNEFAQCNVWTPAEADMLFCSTPFQGPVCTQNGVGFSMLRVMIYEDSTQATPAFPFINNINMARARNPNVRFWFAPWTAPAAWKTTGTLFGGSLCDGTNGCGNVNHYQDWATYLSNYITTLRTTYNVPVYALSVQNEPDFSNGLYRQMVWTAPQFANFIKNYLGPTMQASNPDVRLLFPEMSQWSVSLAATCEADPACAQYINIIAAHGYNQNAPGALATNPGQELWETEDSNLGPPNDTSMSNALGWTGAIHNYWVNAGVNVWNWWWGTDNGDCNGQGLINDSNSGAPCTGVQVAKRLWTTGNWSNWIEPSWVRVDVTANPITNVFLSAFKNPADNTFIIVVDNNTSGTQILNFSGATTSSVTPYITDGTRNLAALAPINVTNGAFTASVTSFSVTTFVSAPTAPVVGRIGWNQIPGTALCGGGTENNATFVDPANFPTNLNAAFPSYGYDFPSNCYAALIDSNSMVYDAQRHRDIIWGGGHGIYHGNDFWSLELDNLGTSKPVLFHLSHSANPNACPGTGPASTTVTESDGSICVFNSAGTLTTVLALGSCQYTAGCTPTGVSPGSVHTYEGIAAIPGFDEMLLVGGASAPNGNGIQTGWLADLSSVLASCAPNTTTNQQGCNPRWTPLGNTTANNFYIGGGVGVMCDYDVATQLVWCQNQSNFQSFNPATNTLTQRNSQVYGSHSIAAIDPEDKLFVMLGTSSTGIDGLRYYSLVGPTYTLTTPTITPSACATALLTGPNVGFAVNTGATGTGGVAMPQYQGFAWDPIGHRFVIYPNGTNTIYFLYPKTWTCTTETYGSTQTVDYPWNSPDAGGGADGTFRHFMYDPVLDIFVLINDPKKDAWYLRLRR